MRGTVAKQLRKQAKKLSKGESAYKKTYKHLKSMYKANYKNGIIGVDVIGDAERKAKLEKLDGKPA